jgi:hypothetical protein
MLHFFFEDIDQPWFLVIVELVLSNVIFFVKTYRLLLCAISSWFVWIECSNVKVWPESSHARFLCPA